MDKQCGTIKIVMGCMFSGKTTSLINLSKTYTNPLCINHESDTRYGDISENKMYSHDLLSTKCVYVSQLKDIEQTLIDNADVILINEGQFFNDLVKYSCTWCETYGKDVVVYGLDGDFKREIFGEILKLIPLSNSVEKIVARCANCNDMSALFSHRKSKEEEQIVIGSSNYEALCRKCYVLKN